MQTNSAKPVGVGGCVSGVDLSFISWSFGRSVTISPPSAAAHQQRAKSPTREPYEGCGVILFGKEKRITLCVVHHVSFLVAGVGRRIKKTPA